MRNKIDPLLIGCKLKTDKFINTFNNTIYDEEGSIHTETVLLFAFALLFAIASKVIVGAVRKGISG